MGVYNGGQFKIFTIMKMCIPAIFQSPRKSKPWLPWREKIKIGDANMYDMETLYARLLVISQVRDITLSEFVSYELSPVPSSLFDDYGD